MKTFGLFAISASALSSKELFDQWKTTFDVKYESPREEALRFDQWMKNKVCYTCYYMFTTKLPVSLVKSVKLIIFI